MAFISYKIILVVVRSLFCGILKVNDVLIVYIFSALRHTNDAQSQKYINEINPRNDRTFVHQSNQSIHINTTNVQIIIIIHVNSIFRCKGVCN